MASSKHRESIKTMPAPQTIDGVHALARKLEREGFIGAGSRRRGEWVQVRFRREVLCAQVVRLLPGSDDRRPSFMVETLAGPCMVGIDAVRQCGTHADGRCACTAGDTARSAGAAGVQALSPLGNTGITTEGVRG